MNANILGAHNFLVCNCFIREFARIKVVIKQGRKIGEFLCACMVDFAGLITYVTGYSKPTIMSHLANCFLLAQLIATLIHYPCTVALMG